MHVFMHVRVCACVRAWECARARARVCVGVGVGVREREEYNDYLIHYF